MKIIRWIVGKILLAWNFLTFPPKGKREPALQEKFNAELKSYRLYQFNACPFCVKVRRHLQRMNLNIELHDAKNDEKHTDSNHHAFNNSMCRFKKHSKT